MKLDEWESISKALFSAFPVSGSADQVAGTLAVYFVDLTEYEAIDVATACTYLRRTVGPFLPSIAELRRQTEAERDARVSHDRLPDFTESHALSEPELRALVDRGMAVAAGARPEPDRASLPANVQQLMEDLESDGVR